MVKHRILLADDSVTIQKVVNLTFADEGIEVVAVGDGDQAMQKFVEAMPDLVMVDVNMPGADGYHICEMIKQDDETKHIPVILLVGSFEPFDEKEARRVGADDFLTKPFQSIRQLVNKVTDLLNGKRNSSFGDEKTVSSFDDTLEMLKPVDKPERKTEFGDAAMDDEMIQTSQIGSLPVNEAQKFESVSKPEDTQENQDSENKVETSDEEPILETGSVDYKDEIIEFDSETIQERANSESETTGVEANSEIKTVDDETAFESEKAEFESTENIIDETPAEDEVLPEEDRGKIESFSEENQFEDEVETADSNLEGNAEDDEPLPRHENIYEFANEQELEDEDALPFADTQEMKADLFEEYKADENEVEKIHSEARVEQEEEEEADQKDLTETDSVAETSSQNPQVEEIEEDKNSPNFETTQEFALDDFDLLELPQARKSKSAEKKIVKEQVSNGTLSPEDIEAIANRVVEKLSGDMMKEIVREVILQTTKND